MSCKDVQRCVHAYIDAELDPKQIIEVESHLAECEDCQRVVEFERWFKSELGQSIGKITAPTSLQAKVGHAMDRDQRKRRVRALLPGSNRRNFGSGFWYSVTRRPFSFLAAMASMAALPSNPDMIMPRSANRAIADPVPQHMSRPVAG